MKIHVTFEVPGDILELQESLKKRGYNSLSEYVEYLVNRDLNSVIVNNPFSKEASITLGK